MLAQFRVKLLFVGKGSFIRLVITESRKRNSILFTNEARSKLRTYKKPELFRWGHAINGKSKEKKKVGGGFLLKPQVLFSKSLTACLNEVFE